MGRVAMQTLIDKIEKVPTQEKIHKLEAGIVVRETT